MAVPVYYAMLGLDQQASDEDIHRAFSRLAAQYGPDSDLEPRLAARRFQAIAEAYAVLGDPVRRAAYDARLSRGTRALPEPAISASDVAPDTGAASAEVSPANPVRRRALLGWLQRHPMHATGIVVLLALLAIGALERPQRLWTSRPALTPAHRVVTPVRRALPSASGTMVAALQPDWRRRHEMGTPAGRSPAVAAVHRPSPPATSLRRARHVSAAAVMRSAPAATPAVPRRATALPAAHHQLPARTPSPPRQHQPPARPRVMTPQARGKGAGTPPAHRATPRHRSMAVAGIHNQRKAATSKVGILRRLVAQIPTVPKPHVDHPVHRPVPDHDQARRLRTVPFFRRLYTAPFLHGRYLQRAPLSQRVRHRAAPADAPRHQPRLPLQGRTHQPRAGSPLWRSFGHPAQRDRHTRIYPVTYVAQARLVDPGRRASRA
ncbi:MAG TPA: DnaJ domain-containing protein [Chloroflexota bacterium]|nr:DnaJ domain-containing protein [Chloroflexota bacterium]